MTTKEKIEVMQAFLDGKIIMRRCPNAGLGEFGIIEDSNPIWDWKNFEYFVKPEPKYRPYNSIEEFLQASKEHGPFLKNKTSGKYYLPCNVEKTQISVILNTSIVCPPTNALISVYPFDGLNGFFTWQDETPCCIKEI